MTARYSMNRLPLPNRIFLVGFMGAGKTTAGKALARRLGYEFRDLDEIIQAKNGRSVRTIFAELGEDMFRRLEAEALESCRDLSRAVVALGGGAYVSEENRALLRELGTTIWIDSPLEVCLSRVGSDPERPLLGNRSEMIDLLNRRKPAYSCADHTVPGGLTPTQVASAIVELFSPASETP